jgi:hypothetical protein
MYIFFNVSSSVTPVKKKKLGKNPDVDTSFLPDREREVYVYYIHDKVSGRGGENRDIGRAWLDVKQVHVHYSIFMIK